MTTTHTTPITIEQLEECLGHSPVIAMVHPLVPLAMKPELRVVADAQRLLSELDQYHYQPLDRILVLANHDYLRARFPCYVIQDAPPPEAINRRMHYHLDYMREFLLTSHKVADRIMSDVAAQYFDVVLLLLIDGLSYADTLHWKLNEQPCFIDGPTVTYRFRADGTIVDKVGFASIIGNPPLAERLYQQGYRKARGYTYWLPEHNAVAERMFRGIATKRVPSFEAVLRDIAANPPQSLTYFQIVRDGLDGLAHNKREVGTDDIIGTLRSLRQDIERLIGLLRESRLRSCMYITSDHGILWKHEHRFSSIDVKGSHPRYVEGVFELPTNVNAVQFQADTQVYQCFSYPFLGSKLPIDDCGIHGGLSFQESIVPFIKIEVAQ